MAERQRSFKNFLINPSFQMRMGLYFVAVTIAVMGILMSVLYRQISEVRMIVANSPGMSILTQVEINAVLSNVINISVSFLVIVTFVIMLFSVIVSHRIAGPMYAIVAYINDLANGRYDSQRNLRPYDELAPIMDSLHSLAAKLKDKK